MKGGQGGGGDTKGVVRGARGRRSRTGPLRLLGKGKDRGVILPLRLCLRDGVLVISPNERLNAFDASVFALNPQNAAG